MRDFQGLCFFCLDSKACFDNLDIVDWLILLGLSFVRIIVGQRERQKVEMSSSDGTSRM